jgi:HEAT repeat protein
VKDRPQEVPADPELEAAVDYCERCERAGIQEVPADPELEAAAWPAPVTPPTWKVFDHPHGRFSVRMPARPETAWGFLPGNYVDVAYLYTLAREAPNLSFTVGYATVGDFTHLPNSPKTPEQLLAVLRDKLVEQAKGKLLRQQTINLDSHPGMEVEVEATQPAAGISRARLYLIRDRLYQLQVAGTKEQVFSLDADVFFGSFQLKGKDPAVYRGKPASYWVEMLQHPEWMNHERAVRALNRMNPEARQAVLAEARAAVYALGMDFLFRGRQEGVIRALAYLGPLAEEAAPLLVQQIKVQRHDSIDEALVKIGPLAVPVLVRDLRVAENDSRILVSMTLLGRIGSAAKAAGSALVPLLKHQKLRLFAAEALLRIGAPEAKEALPILVEATQTGKFVGLPFLGSVGREALPIVAAALKSDQPYVRAEAAATLIQIDPANAEALALLKEFLKGGEPNASIVAARALLRRDAKDKEALFVLAERLRQRQGQSALIVESLAELGPAAREAVPALCQAVTWEDPRQPFNVQGTRFPALKALLRIDPEGCAPVLMQLLKDKDAFVRYRTFAALEEIGPKAPQLVPVIVVALKDMNSYVRETAADYLALLGPAAREAIPALTEATKDPVVNVREAAAQALKDIARNP